MIFSPMVFAGVHVWAYSVAALFSLALFDIRFLSRGSLETAKAEDASIFKRKESIAVLLFLVLSLLYMLPLPREIVKFLSPKIVALRDTYAFEAPLWQTLSVYPRATLSYIIKLAGYICVYFVVLSKITSPPENPPESRPRSVYPAFIMFGALAGVLSILFHSFVDFNLHIPGNTLYFTLLLTIIAALGRKGSEVDYGFLNKMVNAIVMIGFFIALFGIIQRFSWNGKMFWVVAKPGSNFGPFVCYNNFAGFMEMTSFMSIALFYSGIFTSPLRHMKKLKDKVVWFSSAEANQTVLYLFASIVMTAALFLSSSRGGIISFALAFIIFAAVCVAVGPRSRKAKLAISGIVVLCLFVGMILWVGPENTIRRFKKLPEMFQYVVEGRKSFLVLRPLMWIDTLKVIWHFPLVGAGLGTYSNIFIIERTFPANWGFLIYAHQDYLHLLAEMGTIGAGYLILFFIWYIRRFRECLKRLRTGAENLEKY